jgi:hypothetical protein
VAWQPGADADAKDRRAFRDMYMSFGAFIGIAILLTTVAFRASGWRRLPWAVIALLMWLFITWSVAIGVLVATVAAGGKDARHMGGPGWERRQARWGGVLIVGLVAWIVAARIPAPASWVGSMRMSVRSAVSRSCR